MTWKVYDLIVADLLWVCLGVLVLCYLVYLAERMGKRR